MNDILRKKGNIFFNHSIILFVLLFLMMSLDVNANEKYTNSLIKEDSPYLQQHAHNPVNWYAWNEDAFLKAKKENKLIFLSIGYSTCHWCHVMEEESFENEEVAQLLNKDYLSIKVDREEMPHIDRYFQDVHNLLNKRGGGWPLTVILTPEGKAFYAATYIPLEDKYGRVGIKNLLKRLKNIYINEKEKVIKSSYEIERILKEYGQPQRKQIKEIDLKIVRLFVKQIEESFDYENHGIGAKPKFPHTSTIETLLDIYTVFKDEEAKNLGLKMLIAMGNGGIYDQIEGGFYRYSVDEKWMIPHFEKMLYTNAELLSAYSKAYIITKDDFYKEIAVGIIDFVKERFEKEHLFFSASDADSLLGNEKEEGAYFVFIYSYTYDYLKANGYEKKEIKKILNYFNITKSGNFEYKLNNPYLTTSEKPKNLKEVKRVLKNLRESKEYPFIDYKILTSWNAMYISSLFDAGKIDNKYNEEALNHLDTLVEKLYIETTLYHQRILNKKPKVKALFEDYSFLITTLLKAYDYSLDKKYLSLAITLNKEAISKFYRNDIWYMSDDDFQSQASAYDSSYKSTLANMSDNILKIALLSEDLELQELAITIFENYSSSLARQPSNTPWLLRNFMAFEKGLISIKAPKSYFENKNLPSYPFLLKKQNKEDKYLACKVDICFAYSDDFYEIIEEVFNEIEK